ncbi:MAG: heavy-metal-associated domain-containing protein [Planctomycetota bacterium]|jgi:copper chaperone CopZ|nr:heavy-metal-associated domain-containing protein [Planctomycetota bacterium]
MRRFLIPLAIISLLSLAACGPTAAPETNNAQATSEQPATPPADLQLAEGQQQARLAIEGMHCHNCVNAITKQISAVPGVSACVVDLPSEQAVVAYDPKQADMDALIAAVAAVPKASYVAKTAE